MLKSSGCIPLRNRKLCYSQMQFSPKITYKPEKSSLCCSTKNFSLAKSDMIVARPDVGERPEGEGALHFANVVLEDPLRTEREHAVVDM